MSFKHRQADYIAAMVDGFLLKGYTKTLVKPYLITLNTDKPIQWSLSIWSGLDDTMWGSDEIAYGTCTIAEVFKVFATFQFENNTWVIAEGYNKLRGYFLIALPKED